MVTNEEVIDLKELAVQKRLPGTCGVNKMARLKVNVEGLDELGLELGLDR